MKGKKTAMLIADALFLSAFFFKRLIIIIIIKKRSDQVYMSDNKKRTREREVTCWRRVGFSTWS